MKKRLFSILLVTAMSVSLLSACGKSDETTGADTTTPTESIGAKIEVKEEALTDVKVEGDFSDADLTVFIFAQDHEKTVYQSLIDKFKESTGAKVTFEVTTADEYGQKILAIRLLMKCLISFT